MHILNGEDSEAKKKKSLRIFHGWGVGVGSYMVNDANLMETDSGEKNANGVSSE